MLNILKRSGLLLWYVLILIILIMALQYLLCPVYQFEKRTPFHGVHWYNPYENIRGHWLKGNFHLHAHSWGGVTNGDNQSDTIYQFYKDMGYDIVAFSDYQKVNTYRFNAPDYIPVYEHGYSLFKTHQLAIGAEQVEWRDYFFGQHRHHKQNILNRLSSDSTFIVLAHPPWMGGYSHRDMIRLTGFDAIEINKKKMKTLQLWDTALSSGKVAWIMGNDDSHDIHHPRKTGVRWTMINANSPRKKDVISALKKGQMYAVTGHHGRNNIFLKNVEIDSSTLKITIDKPADKIRFIGNNGEILKIVMNNNTAEIELREDYFYVRTEIISPTNSIYLNPVIRYNGRDLPTYSNKISIPFTVLQNVIMFSILAAIVLFIRKRQMARQKKQPTPYVPLPFSNNQKKEKI